MDVVQLPIYKVADPQRIGRFHSFTVHADTDYTLTLVNALTEGNTYEVTIEFYTDAAFGLSLYAGDTRVELFDQGTTHKSVTSTFDAPSDLDELTLRLDYNRPGAWSAYVANMVIRSLSSSSTGIRYISHKWEFHDEAMGERYVMLNAQWHQPIDWHIGDYLVYRGQTYYLNNVPSVVQNARPDEAGNAFVYDNIRFDDEQGKLYNCMVLDVTPTTGDYVASEGTNYTGSSSFTIYCAETTVTMIDVGGGRHDVTLSPVAYLGGIVQANLNRLYPQDHWRVVVNPDLTGLDDKVVTANQWYVPQALAEIHNQWDVDYICIGQTIMIGYTLNNITGDDSASYMFGYGEGYARRGDDGKSLFTIKRTINSSQRIITRLRAMGSTRNMPYRYYHSKYTLPQAMYVQNLQLPDTFETPEIKDVRNELRDETYGMGPDGYPLLRHVLGDTNDAYLDKYDDAELCSEGIREGAAFWDGSNSDLEEIYPTIKSGTYLDLRAADIPDMDGRIPSQQTHPTDAYPNYDNGERIDELLGVDEKTNIGDGVVPEAEARNQTNTAKHVEVASKQMTWTGNNNGSFEQNGSTYIAKAAYIDTLYGIKGVASGKYHTEPVTQNVKLFLKYASTPNAKAKIRFRFRVYATDEEETTTMIAEHIAPVVEVTANETDFVSVNMPSIPNVTETSGESDTSLEVESTSDITVKFALELTDVANIPNGTITYYINSDVDTVEPEYVWGPLDYADTFMQTPFSIYIKDIGVDLTNISTTGEDAVIHFNTGACGGMEFKWNPNTATPITIGNKKGWKIDINERFEDSTIHAYYPNSLSPLTAGDQFVLLNIEFPEAYIKLAEIRLLQAATDYLADNCEPKYTYEPEVSSIYIQQNIDFAEASGVPQASVYWNLYAGYKFSMRGIPNTVDEVLPIVDNVTIKTVVIREGEQDTPKVEIVLNDEVEQTTIQKLTVTVDRIYNGIFGRGGGGSSISYSTLISLLNSEGIKLFLSKKNNDTAQGKITFNKGLDTKGDIRTTDFVADSGGAGIYQDEHGDWHIEGDFLHARKKLTAKEVQVEEVSHIGGAQLLTAASAQCAFVVDKGDYWRCFFVRVGDDGKKITNKWKVGDQAYCNTFNLERQENNPDGTEGAYGNHYYWRLVVGCSNDSTGVYDDSTYTIDDVVYNAIDYHYIDLSKSLCGSDSSTPKAGDDIVQLGYQGTDGADRQNAIIIAGAGTGSPYIRQYTGIDTFHIPDPDTQIKPGDNKFTGIVNFQSGSKLPDGTDLAQTIDDLIEGQEEWELDVDGLTTGNENLLRNTGFTGDYESGDVETETNVTPDTPIYSPQLKYWECENVRIATTIESATGMSAVIERGYIQQMPTKALEAGEEYCISFKANGGYIYVNVGGYSEAIELSTDNTRKIIKFTCTNATDPFKLSGSCQVMEIQLTKGNIPNADWIPSPLDNDKAISKFQDLVYLTNAITNANTTILGGLILSQMFRVGNYRDGIMTQETGGMSGLYQSGNSPFLWGGGDMEKAFYTIGKYANNPSYQASDEEVAQMAKFVVTHGGRAILNDIILRGYIYAVGGVFKNVTSPNRGFVINDDGYFECNDAKIRGSLYTPLTLIDDDNFDEYIIQGEYIEGYGKDNVVNLDATGMNIQAAWHTSVDDHYANIWLPINVERYNGAQAHIHNRTDSSLTIYTGGSHSAYYELSGGHYAIFVCYMNANGNYHWMKIN